MSHFSHWGWMQRRGAIALWVGVGMGVSLSPAALALEPPSPATTAAPPAILEPNTPKFATLVAPVGPVSVSASASEPASVGQAQPHSAQLVLPFSDVPPDHWAYEALLYLSTGQR